MANHSQQHLQKLFQKAATNLQSGNVSGALKGFEKLSKQLPESAVIWYNLALCYQHSGQHSKASNAYSKSLAVNAQQPDGWINLAISQKELRQSDKAIASVERALKLVPEHPRALNFLASMQAENGEIEQARNNLNQSLQGDPNQVDARINLANLEFSAGNYEVARKLTTELVNGWPNNNTIKLLDARLLIHDREYNLASPIVRDLEKELPEDEEVLRLGISFREAARDHFGVIGICEKFLRINTEDAKVLNSMAGAYFQLDGIDKSLEFYAKALALEPENAEYQTNIGLAYSAMGDKSKAEQHFRKSIALQPKHSEAYRQLAAMKKFSSIDDDDAQQVIRIWQSEELEDLNRIKTAFALGKIYDDCGEYEKAFEVYSVGNELKFRDSRIDLDQYYSHIDRIPEVFDSPPFKVNQKSPEICPIFILGMPRSGTTLVEQILSRHSDVFGCGELPCIERSISRLEKKSATQRIYPDDFWNVGRDELEAESDQYMDWVKRLHDIKTPYLTDKMPFNYTHVWLIKAMFPNSPVINCQRHPLDVITSNYFQLYGSDVSFVYNLDALANYYVRYHRLMNHWQDVFGDQVYNAVYEALVADTENQTRALVAAAGLDWQDNCLDQSTSDTAVRTASIWQVRQGIYTSSRERWRNYEPHLSGVIEILSSEGILDSQGNWIAQAATS